MPSSDQSLGLLLDAWLNRLDQEGFQVGVRERLQVHTLFAQLSAGGELAKIESVEQILELARPLLCTQPEQQRRYALLLAQFLAQQTTRADNDRTGQTEYPLSRTDQQKPRKFKLWHAALITLLVIVIVLAAKEWIGRASPPPVVGTDMTGKEGAQPSLPATTAPAPRELPRTLTFEQLVSSAAFMPEWLGPVRISLLIMGGASLLICAGLIWGRWRRQRYLQSIRTDQEIEEYFLFDPHPVQIEPSPALIRQASRIMRQRHAGERTALDVLATLRATVRVGGMLSPRYRLLTQTPEYLALIDQRHPDDHHAANSKALVDALLQKGVAVQIMVFEGSPETGCWRLRAGSRGVERFGWTPFSELAVRYTGHRLLVFAETQALVDEVSGLPRPWTHYLNAFPQRTWFTPLPLSAWGWMEQVADKQGFLVLPVQPESLITAAGWFSAGQLGLEIAADWPLDYPPMLRADGMMWIIQQTAPPAGIQEELLFQLRHYLGAQRFQWLCACAIFPAISPTLTLALGRELSADARDLALGMAAIGALPWFRYAFMPAWLRMRLINRLDPPNEAQFRQIIEARLSSAIEGSGEHPRGAPLMTFAQRKHQLMAWFHRRRGLARDVVLVDFLQSGTMVRLALRLPEGLRKWLFHQGLPSYGLSRSALWALPICLLLGLVGWKGEFLILNQIKGPQVILLPVDPPPIADNNSCNIAGQVDSYVLALSWQPAFCETNPQKAECQFADPNVYQAKHFALQGLWPNQRQCGINYGFCGEVAARPVSFCDYPEVKLDGDSKAALAEVMPGVTVGSCHERHQWYKHGTCQTNWSIKEFFDLMVNLTHQFNDSGLANFMSRRIGQQVRTEEFLNQVSEVLGSAVRNRIFLRCERGMLVGIQLSLNADLSLGADLKKLIINAPTVGKSNCGEIFLVDDIGTTVLSKNF